MPWRDACGWGFVLLDTVGVGSVVGRLVGKSGVDGAVV